MRKITEKAAKAFILNQSFSSGNTQVKPAKLRYESPKMYLHGHCIAIGPVLAEDRQNIYIINFCGWPTPTTKERVNGIFQACFNRRPFHTVGGQLCYDGTPIDDNTEIGFNSNGRRIF